MKIVVKAIPNAKKSEIKIEKDADGKDFFKIKILAKPQDGQANEAIIKILANYFNVKKSAIKLIVGEKNRNKIFEVNFLEMV